MAKTKPKWKPHAKSKAKRKPRAAHALPERLPVAEFKAQLSRFLRDVQARGQSVTITMHGRDIAVLSPPKTAAEAVPLNVRPPLDPRPLAELIKSLEPLPDGSRVSENDIREALDWTRADRF